MFFMVRVSKPSLFLQVCRLPVPPCFDDRHDGLFLVLCPSWPGSIMVTPWTLLVVPPLVLSSWFLPGPFLMVHPWVVLSLWSLPWSFPRGSSLVLSSWFLPGLFLLVPPWVVLSLWSLPWSFLVVPPGPCALSLSLFLSLYLPHVSLFSSSLRYCQDSCRQRMWRKKA